MALSKNRIKYIRSLELKKNRDADQVFVAEGPKLVNELLGRFPCLLLAGTSEWAARNPHPACDEFVEVSDEELGRASFLKQSGTCSVRPTRPTCTIRRWCRPRWGAWRASLCITRPCRN